MIDDLSSKIEICKGIFLSQAELDICVKLKGSIENVQAAIAYILASPRRKREITDWPNALAKWKIENKTKVKIEENFEYAEKLCIKFSDYKKGNGWRCSLYHDKIKDQKCILFEPENTYTKSQLVAFADSKFKEICVKLLETNKMEINNPLTPM